MRLLHRCLSRYKFLAVPAKFLLAMIDEMLFLFLFVLGIVAIVQSRSQPIPESQKFPATSTYTAREAMDLPSLAGFSNATFQQSYGGQSFCISGIVPVHATAANVNLTFQAPENVFEATQDLVSFVEQGSAFTQRITNSTQNITGTYDIYASLCLPENWQEAHTVQFLTHGLGFDHLYWDFPGYSYVDAATSEGYATFSYDRLGNGRSSRPDPISVIQAPLQVAIAEQLLSKLHSGTFSNLHFSKLAVVGHSYGSVITEALVADPSNHIDAAVFTGFTLNFTGIPNFLLDLNLDIASQSQPERFPNLSTGFLIPSNTIGWQIGFFTWPNFSPDVLKKVAQIGSTLTFGELFSRSAITKSNTDFAGPVFIINGNEDLPYCSGNCSSPTNKAEDTLKSAFAKSSNATSYLVPRTGHALNMHFTAADAYARILAFLKENGIQA